jgi:adenylosuccinate synthase
VYDLPVDLLDRAEPVFEQWEGWSNEVANARDEEMLPRSVRRYLAQIEERVEVPVAIASVGAERDATIIRREVFTR